MSPKRRYDPEAARQDILDAAEEAFQERGFGGVSTSAIARAAGVSQSQIHYHFENKKNLYVEVFTRRFGQYFAAQSELFVDDELQGLDRLGASVEAYFRFFQNHPGFARLMMRAQLDRKEVQIEMPGHLLRAGAEVIADSQRQGLIRDDVPAEHILLSFLAMVTYWFVTREHHMGDLDPDGDLADHDEAYLDAILKIFLRGNTPEPRS